MMLKSDELRQKIFAKRSEVKKLQKAEIWDKALKAANELDALCDEFEVALSMEKSKLENFLADATPAFKPNYEDNSTPIGCGAVATKKYRDAFFNAVRKNFQNDLDPILKEGVDTKGGYLVPSEMHATISEKLKEENVMRQLATVIQTSSTHRIPIVASQPAAAWTKELQKIDLSSEDFEAVELDAYKLATGLKVSNELLADSSYNLEMHFVNQFTQVIGNSEEDSFINGSGIDQPTGFLTDLKDDSDACVNAISPSGIDMYDVLNLIYSIRRPYRKGACFLLHDSALLRIRRLVDETGNFLWTPSTTAGEPSRLLGYPIFTSSFFPAIAAEPASGDILMAYGDFSKYYVAERGVRQFRPLRELFALEDATAFLMIERVDGRLIDKDAVRLLKIKSA